MNVTVLFGGPSAEREVSLKSGHAVIEGLRTSGHTVEPSDISPSDLSGLMRPADVIFPVLHGQFGESGELQELLEQRGLAFVGSGSMASRAGMNKDRAKQIWLHSGLPTATHRVVSNADEIALALQKIGAPCVVKPIDSGSSIDVFICDTIQDASTHAAGVVSRHGQAMIETFIKGTEFTVGILEERALSPIRITTNHKFFDYQAKYIGNDAEHHFELNLSADATDALKQTALAAHLALGCRDLSRVDFIVDESGKPWILEINTMPGFTNKSLLPEAAKHDGTPFDKLVDRLVNRAFARGGRTVRAAI